jgi:hypothetical protein
MLYITVLYKGSTGRGLDVAHAVAIAFAMRCGTRRIWPGRDGLTDELPELRSTRVRKLLMAREMLGSDPRVRLPLPPQLKTSGCRVSLRQSLSGCSAPARGGRRAGYSTGRSGRGTARAPTVAPPGTRSTAPDPVDHRPGATANPGNRGTRTRRGFHRPPPSHRKSTSPDGRRNQVRARRGATRAGTR